MANRTLLCVEPDARDAALIRDTLTPHGFQVKNLTSGEQAIDWGRRNGPSVIVVCVEPRKVGYAICNKIKRSPELRDVPLILTSAEETKHTFEQHKKLKSRAEEYILKPLKREELLAKIGQVLGIGPLQPMEGGDSEEEEIAIGDQDIVDERSGSIPIDVHAGSSNGGRPTTTSEGVTRRADLDAIFDQETEAAFAAIQSRGDSDPTGPLPGSGSGPHRSPQAPSPPAAVTAPPAWDPDGWNDEATHATSVPAAAGFGLAGMAPAPPPPAPASDPGRPSYGMDGADVPPSPDDVMHPAASDISVPITIASGAHEARLSALQGMVNQLEADKHRMQNEVEELRARLQAQPITKEKDMLSLREIINRKEKDVLDLRDALDAKERQILDHKDRVREHERARRDLEEKMLGIEKNLVGATERVGALSHDKEKAIERERGLKSRLDDAMSEIQKAHEEVDSLKRRLQADADKARSELDRTRGELESRIAELEESHRGQITKLNDERASADATRDKEHQAEIARIDGARIAEVEVLQKRLADELAAHGERSQSELTKLRRDQDKALASLKEEQAVQITAERQAHQAAIEGKERDHRNEILGLRRRHEEELAALEERRQRELAEAETRRVADLEAAENKRRGELQARDEEHHAVVAEMDRRHFDEKTAMGERHRNETDQAVTRAARAEGELAARNEELSEAYRKIAGREADLDALRADVREREVKMGQARDRVTDLEAKIADLEDQVLRAYQKLRTDEKTVDKAKRALAVALSLLDPGVVQAAQAQVASGATATGAGGSGPAPAGPATGTGSGAQAGGGSSQRAPEESST